MKPGSIKLFDMLFPLAALLVLVSAFLSFGSLEDRALLGFGGEGEGARGMAIWMVIASLFIFVLLASIIWSTISLLRMRKMRWVLALVVTFALYQSVRTLVALGPHMAGFVDLASSLIAGAAVLILFRPDARAWFAEKPDQRFIP